MTMKQYPLLEQYPLPQQLVTYTTTSYVELEPEVQDLYPVPSLWYPYGIGWRGAYSKQF